MASLTVSEFRIMFAPRFDSEETFDNANVQTMLTVASNLVNEDRWGDLAQTGIGLYAAHHLVVDAMLDEEQASGAGTHGLRGGAIASESGEGLSVSYDVSGAAEEGAGHWNQTVYGRRYIRLARLHGAGAIQIGAASGGEWASAWPGPQLM